MATFLSGPNLGPAQAAYLANLEDMYSAAQGRQGGGLNSVVGYGGGGGRQGGGGSSGYYGGAIPDAYQRAQEEAKAANEQRYQDILSGYQNRSNEFQQRQSGNTDDVLTGYENRYQRGMDLLSGLGTQEKRDIDESYQKLGASNQQDMVNRGLTGTTIMPTMRSGIERERQDALSRVNERLQREQLLADAGLSGDALGAQERMYGQGLAGYMGATGDTLGFAERRSDTYPDFNQLLGLAQQYGASGAGYSNPNDPGYSMVNPSQLGYNIPGMGGQGYGGMPTNHGMRNWVQPWARPQQQQPQQPQQFPQGGGFQILPWTPQTVDGMVPPQAFAPPVQQLPQNPVNALPYDWQWNDPESYYYSDPGMEGMVVDPWGNSFYDPSLYDQATPMSQWYQASQPVQPGFANASTRMNTIGVPLLPLW